MSSSSSTMWEQRVLYGIWASAHKYSLFWCAHRQETADTYYFFLFNSSGEFEHVIIINLFSAFFFLFFFYLIFQSQPPRLQRVSKQGALVGAKVSHCTERLPAVVGQCKDQHSQVLWCSTECHRGLYCSAEDPGERHEFMHFSLHIENSLNKWTTQCWLNNVSRKQEQLLLKIVKSKMYNKHKAVFSEALLWAVFQSQITQGDVFVDMPTVGRSLVSLMSR